MSSSGSNASAPVNQIEISLPVTRADLGEPGRLEERHRRPRHRRQAHAAPRPRARRRSSRRRRARVADRRRGQRLRRGHDRVRVVRDVRQGVCRATRSCSYKGSSSCRTTPRSRTSPSLPHRLRPYLDRRDAAFGRTWTPIVEVLGARELGRRAPTSTWDLVPQLQVTLSTRQHVMASFGLRVPVTRAGRPCDGEFVSLTSVGTGSTAVSARGGSTPLPLRPRSAARVIVAQWANA